MTQQEMLHWIDANAEEIVENAKLDDGSPKSKSAQLVYRGAKLAFENLNDTMLWGGVDDCTH
jgi:hypothetical protein